MLDDADVPTHGGSLFGSRLSRIVGDMIVTSRTDGRTIDRRVDWGVQGLLLVLPGITLARGITSNLFRLGRYAEWSIQMLLTVSPDLVLDR